MHRADHHGSGPQPHPVTDRRPQQRRVKAHQEMIKNVRRGDTVVTSGGIIGKVTKVLEDSADVEVEIADGVKVKVARAMISEVRSKSEPVKA